MSGDSPVQDLAAATLKLLARQKVIETWRTCVEALERQDALAMKGQRELLDDLQRHLGAALKALQEHELVPQTDLVHALLCELDDVSWDVAADLQPELERDHQALMALLQEVGYQVTDWGRRLDELKEVLDHALRDGAPFVALEHGLKAAKARLASLRTALTEQRYAELAGQRLITQQAITEIESRIVNAGEQVQRIKTLVRQADLLIMRTGEAGDEYVYSVLLRSADRAQSRGMNIIQKELRVSKADRDDYLVRCVADLTGGINRHLRRRHEARGDAVMSADLPPGPDPEAAMQEVGRFLWQMFIPGEMQTLLRRQNWSLSITTNDLELPWELICFNDDADATPDSAPGSDRYFCLSKSVSRMPLGDTFPTARPLHDPSARRRMLLIHSDPHGNLPAAAIEADAIASALGDRLDIVRLNPADVTNARLNQLLSVRPAFDFIHYAGHARFDTQSPNDSGLLLQDGSLLKADKIRKLSQGGSLVFLNACESGMVARTSEAQQVSYLLSHPPPVVGLASAFIYSGALGCIGSLWPVYDDAAAQLAVQFYRFVLDGDPTGEALRRARADTRRAYPDGMTWASYVLYGDPTFRLTEY